MKKLVDLIHMQTRPTDLDQLRTCLSSQFNVNKYELDQQLLFLKSAHPILIALKERGVHQLVQTLDEAEEPALNAFNQLTMNQPLNKLVKLFLINNTKELEQARGLLIDLVRQPDLSTILNQQLDSIARDAIKTMSQRYLLLALEKPTCELQKIIALRHFLTENPFIIQTEVLWIINELYTDELNKDLYSPISHAYITLIYDLLISMNLSQQRELIRTINQKSLLLIIQYSLKGMTDDALSQQHMCTHLLRLLCTNASIRDRASQRLITATLNQPDSYLFDQTPPLAKSNANWLFTLLTSPDYIATCSVRTLKRLSDRYKISSFWEKQSSNPARFTHIIEQQSYLGKQIKSSINQIVEFHSTHQEAEQKTLIKKEKIAQFTTNIELTELFLQLEQKCQPENRNHQKALIKLYSYYQQSHSM